MAGSPLVVGRDTGSLRSAFFGGHLNFTSGYGIQGTEFSVYGNTSGLYLNSNVSGDAIIFQTHNGSSIGERLRITSAGDVGINVTPTNTDMAGVKPRLHVLGISTAGQFNTVARFQSGPDNNDSGAAVVINHTNDRGLVIQGGRGGDADGSHHANSGLARLSIIVSLFIL